MSTKTLTTALSFATFLGVAPAFAEEIDVPRGREIRALAGNCGIGPFGQSGKAGEYNIHCASLTDAEKCLAVIKQSFNQYNGATRPSFEPEKAAHCIDLLRAELLSNQ